MTVVINGTTGITSVNGTAGAPSVTGTDTDTGIVYGTNTLSLATGGTTAVTVDSSQNVGIGTSSPAITLDVRSTAAAAARFSRSGTAGQLTSIVFEDGSGTLGSANTTRIASASGYMAFSTGGTSGDTSGGTERARIDSSGNLLVGTTASLYSIPNGVAMSGGGVGVVVVGHANGTSSGNGFINFNYNGGTIGAINQNGTTAVSYNTSSDYRLKENIQPMQNALGVVAQLNPVTYNWKADGSDGQGFIAHELQAVVPDCVTGEKDAVQTYVDEEGNEQTRPVYQGIDTSFLVATLTAAIQEQQAIITQLQADVAALKAA